MLPARVYPIRPGYWPRWALVWSLIAFSLALVRLFPALGLRSWPGRLGLGVLGTSAWYALVVGGIGLELLNDQALFASVDIGIKIIDGHAQARLGDGAVGPPL